MIERKVTLSGLGHFISELTKILQASNNPQRVIIKEWKESRSLSQNAIYWKWLAEIDRQAPLTCDAKISGSEMWHEVFKKYYCPVKSIKNHNAEMQIQSTKMLDVGEMTYYLNRVESWCFDRGIKLTIPIDSEYNKLMERQNG